MWKEETIYWKMMTDTCITSEKLTCDVNSLHSPFHVMSAFIIVDQISFDEALELDLMCHLLDALLKVTLRRANKIISVCFSTIWVGSSLFFLLSLENMSLRIQMVSFFIKRFTHRLWNAFNGDGHMIAIPTFSSPFKFWVFIRWHICGPIDGHVHHSSKMRSFHSF